MRPGGKLPGLIHGPFNDLRFIFAQQCVEGGFRHIFDHGGSGIGGAEKSG
jgi:hypothetical protein